MQPIHIKNFILCIRLACLAIMLLAGGTLQASSCMKIAFSERSVLNDAQQFVFKRIYQQAGLCLESENLPNKRSDIYLERGLLDGDAFAATEAIAKSPGLVIVPAPLLVDTPILVMRADQTRMPGDLSETTGLKIGIKRGSKWEQRTARQSNLDYWEVDDRIQLFEMLERQHIDAALMRKLHLEIFPHLRGIDPSAFAVAIDLGRIEFHHSLRVEHKALVHRISQAIITLQEKGEIPLTAEDWARLVIDLEKTGRQIQPPSSG